MSRLLYTSSLLNAFGKGRQPLRSAGIKLALLLAAALAGSWLLYRQLSSIPLSPFGEPVFLAAALATTTHGAISLTLLASSGALRSTAHDRYARLISYWPLKPSERLITLLLPTGCISFIVMTALAPSLATVSHRLGLAPAFIVLSLAGGWLSGIGAVWGVPAPLQLIVVPAALACSYKLTATLREQTITWPAISLVLLYGLLIACLGQAHRMHGMRPRRLRQVRTSQLSRRWWFAKILWRSPHMQLNTIASFLLSGGVAILVLRTTIMNTTTVSMLLATLAAATAADIRTIAPHQRPPHIVALRGTGYFIRDSLSLVLPQAIIATAPLLIAMTLRHASLVDTGISLLFGMSVGYFAGHLIAPAARDLSAQCTAMFIAIGLLAAIERLSALINPGAPPGSPVRIIITFCLLLAAYAVERRRNSYLWSK